MNPLDRRMERVHGRSMEDILAELVSHAADLLEAPQKYIIEGSVTGAHLRALPGLPFEVPIFEHKGKLILATGTEETVSEDIMTKRGLIGSKLSFHAHANINGVVFDAPSFDDLRIALERGQRRGLMPPILAHRDGLVIYSINQRQFDAITHKMSAWREANRKALYASDIEQHIETIKLQAAAEREFAERAHAIVFECTWDDKRGVERILDMFHAATD